MPDTVNASIPLQADPLAFQRGYQSVQQNMLGGMQIQQQQRALQSQNAIRQIFADPTSVDTKTGAPTANVMNRIMAIDPNVGMAIRQQVTQQERAQAGLQFDRSKINSALQDQIRDVGTDSLTAYEKALSDGHSPTEAKQVAQDVYTSGFNGIKSSGLAGPEILQNLDPHFDPVRVRTNIDWFKQRDADRRLSREDASQAETERHDRAMENRTGASPGAAAERDAEMIAADNIAAKEATLGRPLTDAEKAKERQDARTAPRVAEAGAKKEAMKGPGFTPEMSELMGEMAMRGVTLPAGLRSKEQQIAAYQGVLDANKGKPASQIAEGIMNGQIELGAIKKETQTAGGIAGRVEVARNELAEFVPLAREASDAVPRGKWLRLNKLIQMADSEISDPSLKALKVRINAVLNAYDVLAARGGTDKDKRQETRDLLLSADGPEAFDAALKSFTAEADAAKRAAEAAIKPPGAKDKPAPAVPEAKPAQKAAGGIATPTSKAEFDALPAGAKYRKPGDPADKYRVKP